MAVLVLVDISSSPAVIISMQHFCEHYRVHLQRSVAFIVCFL